jgi:predicted nuclease with RNAse H fold
MDVLGVDLATEPAGTAACWVRSESGRTRLEVVTGRLDDDLLVDVLASADRAAIDSPFGWPEPFVAAITRWQSEGSFPPGPRRPLRMRATDMYIQERALTPFSVSADRIGAVAMRCSLLLSRLAEREGKAVDRVNGRVVECYPSAALYRFGFSRAELRGAKTDSDVRARLLDEILARTVGWLQLGSEEKEDLVAVGDVFDAFLATLVARAAALGLTDQPPPHLATLARREGWIHLPVDDALARLGADA